MNMCYFGSEEFQFHANPETLKTARIWKVTGLSEALCMALNFPNRNINPKVFKLTQVHSLCTAVTSWTATPGNRAELDAIKSLGICKVENMVSHTIAPCMPRETPGLNTRAAGAVLRESKKTEQQADCRQWLSFEKLDLQYSLALTFRACAVTPGFSKLILIWFCSCNAFLVASSLGKQRTTFACNTFHTTP